MGYGSCGGPIDVVADVAVEDGFFSYLVLFVKAPQSQINLHCYSSPNLRSCRENRFDISLEIIGSSTALPI